MIAATSVGVPTIVQLLRDAEVLREEQIPELTRLREDNPGFGIEEALIFGGLTHETAIAEAYARLIGANWLGVTAQAPDDDTTEGRLTVTEFSNSGAARDRGDVESILDDCRAIADQISETLCRQHRVVPVLVAGGFLDLACLDPSQFMALEEVRLRSGCVVRPFAATFSLVEELLARFFGERDMVRELATEAGPDDPIQTEDLEEEVVFDLERRIAAGREGHVVRIVNLLMKGAIEQGASDIHLEPYEDTVRVRYRVDGKLVEVTPPPRPLFVPAISRLKILSKLDIAEKRVPQDGAIALKRGDSRIDLRVSTVPTVYGEKMCIRLLEKGGIPPKLEDLGFSQRQATDFMEAAHRPHGLIFVTGPTGSGKSTTLYCCLSQLNIPTRNIVTVEDPVEYKFRGLNQVHVRHSVGLSFASALRAFLRQDPDVIMVGEVRDQETAAICMRAAMTGHLVISTLHTNNSLQVINRLTDMGIEPFLLGPALRLIEAQRLVRRLCVDCKRPYDLPEDVADRYGFEPGTTVYRPGDEDCPTCRGSGYKGRVGLYEVVPITETLKEFIVQRATESELRAAAVGEGMQFLSDAARQKVRDGVTSVEEVAEYIRM